MADDDSFNPQREQEQERVVLQSILMEEFRVPEKQPRKGTVVEIRILPFPSELSGENHSEVLLTAHLEPSYPIVLPRIELKAMRGLADSEVKMLDGELRALISQLAGQTMLMELSNHARDFIRERNRPEQSLYEQMQQQHGPGAAAPSLAPLADASAIDDSLEGGASGVRLEEVEAELDEAARKKSALLGRGKGKAKKASRGQLARSVGGRHASDSSDEDTTPRPSPSTPVKARWQGACTAVGDVEIVVKGDSRRPGSCALRVDMPTSRRFTRLRGDTDAPRTPQRFGFLAEIYGRSVAFDRLADSRAQRIPE